ncbi:peptidase S41 [Aquimarina sp. U1-2]|uniref:S41 family peptidase n=1 Tax=Aquimarina sp. U1-2 TaxID=2823141 RepID=UPI001AEC7324|nr:S41 family peptidase [Aquimarina sp. U1-2]MBP2832964.1 peptidase S41 [Aquimarina sp. U1-2]
MKKKAPKFIILFFSLFFILSCSNDDDRSEAGNDSSVINNPDEQIDDFVWKAMNFWYLYKSDVPDLNDTKIDNIPEYRQFLSSFDSPINLFDALVTKEILLGRPEDDFSFIVDDYIALEQQLGGTSKSNGMQFLLGRIGNSNDLFGYVIYIMPGTDAQSKGIQRGELFTTINNTQLTISNYEDLLFGSDSYEVGFSTIVNNTFQFSKSVVLNKQVYTENPIFMAKTINYKGSKVGYFMYNGFTFGFNKELNDVFLKFKSEGIENVVLDLRYNGGGSVYTAAALASMITGKTEEEIFAKNLFNDDIESIVSNQSNADAFLNERFMSNVLIDTSNTQEPIHSLGLNKLYVLATRSSASASELIINGLSAHIDVIHIGTKTRGKYQASRTLYDSETFSREGANPNHTFALQPLVSKISNINGKTDYILGLDPTIELAEDFQNLGILGDTNEPLLNTALELITTNSVPAAVSNKAQNTSFEILGDSKMNQPLYQRMYLDK